MKYITRAMIHLAWLAVAMMAAKTGHPAYAGISGLTAFVAPILIINGRRV